MINYYNAMLKIVLVLLCILIPILHTSNNISAADPAKNSDLTIHFIDVGQGDSTLIALPDGQNVLVDTGSVAGAPHLIAYLKSLGIRRISHLICTHPHDDHIGGIFSIAAEFQVDNFHDNGLSNFKSTLFGDYINLVRDDLSRYSILQSGVLMRFGNIEINVLNPLLPPTGNLNDDSVALLIKYGKTTILLAGDIGHTGEMRLVNAGMDLKSNILKIGHHGNAASGSEEFLDMVQPETVIISAGNINAYAVPHSELINHLKKRGIRIFRTDKDGSIVIRTDGQNYDIRALNKSP